MKGSGKAYNAGGLPERSSYLMALVEGWREV
jgi:hypothetical protein